MAKDIHKNKFDKGTQVKLKLVKLYFREWLPVFLNKASEWKEIYIYDFFAGEGKDIEDNDGSPLILLKELIAYCKIIVANRIKVNLLFNDKNKKKYTSLIETKNDFIAKCRSENDHFCCKPCKEKDECPIKIEITNRDFESLFNELYPVLQQRTNIPQFMFIDQYGIKFVGEDIFNKLTSLQRTDFLFFISSSAIKRFADTPEIQKFIKIDKEKFENSSHSQLHRIVTKRFKELKPKDKEYFIGSFSIKKEHNPNIYGLIFGSNSPKGMKKFLSVAWKEDTFDGEANHNIDSDILRTGSLSLFEQDNTIKKLDEYETNLMEYTKIPKSNVEIFIFSLHNGISTTKTNEMLNRLEKDNKITVTGENRRKGAFYLDYKPEKTIEIKSK